MRFTAALVAVASTGNVLSAPCPSAHLQVRSADGSQKLTDVVVINQADPIPRFEHCSTLNPNNHPDLTLIISPPGCLFFGVDGLVEETHLPMKMSDDSLMHWVPATEYKKVISDTKPVTCSKVHSRTTTGDKLIVIGENCSVSGAKECPKPKLIDSKSTCALGEVVTGFEQPTGWHRTIRSALVGGKDTVAFQWLPRQLFAETDELDRKAKATSVTLDVNIENPSIISPPQIVQVDAWPIPVHARVNPPKRGETHFKVQLPSAVWFLTAKGQADCSTETLDLASFVGLPPNMRFGFTKGLRLIRTKDMHPEEHSSVFTTIPSGNPDDLLLAVVTTASSAVAGALAIIIASLRK